MVSWTSPYDAPFGWNLEESSDGGVTWFAWDSTDGAARSDGGADVGFLMRMYAPLSDGVTPGTPYSNIITVT